MMCSGRRSGSYSEAASASISFRRTRPFRRRGIRRDISCRPLRRRGAAIVGQQRMHEIPEDVIGGDVAFLDAVDRGRRHHEAMVDHAARAHLPPSPPASPIVARPISLALAKADIRFAELPLVDMPISPSPARACAITWRTNTCSKPTSLPTAVIIAMSATRLIAASAGRPAVIGCTNSTATCDASQLEPPLPIENSRPPRR